jgi:hypothetical protein
MIVAEGNGEMICDPATGVFLFWIQASAVLAATGLGGMAMTDQLTAIDPAAFAGWEGVTFKVFLIICVGVSMAINFALLKWVAGQLIPTLKEISVASAALKDAVHHLSNATKRCMKHQGIDLEAAE